MSRDALLQTLEMRSPTRAGRIYALGMLALIFLNVLAVILETLRPLYLEYQLAFDRFETFSVAAFTLDVSARFLLSREKGKFFRRPLNVIDVIAVLPAFVHLAIPVDLRFARVLRLVRLLRVLKLARYSQSLHRVGRAFREGKEDLVLALGFVLMLLLGTSSLLYFIEHEAQPEAFASIPHTMWWAVTALTTVGYGDMTPITPLGRIVASVIQVLGIGIFALPTGMLASRLASISREEEREAARVCPHCGKPIEGD